jgi:hypothetical protein
VAENKVDKAQREREARAEERQSLDYDDSRDKAVAAATSVGGAAVAATQAAKAGLKRGESVADRVEAIERTDPDYADRHAHDDLVEVRPENDPELTALQGALEMEQNLERGFPVADVELMEFGLSSETARIEIVKVQEHEINEIKEFFADHGCESMLTEDSGTITGIPLMPLLRLIGGSRSGRHRVRRRKGGALVGKK